MKIANAELKVIRFGADDVIATSVYFYNNGGNYTLVLGEMTDYEPEAEGWHIFDRYTEPSDADQRQGYVNSNSPSAYDAYEYYVTGRGIGYYTKGASYYDLYGNQ